MADLEEEYGCLDNVRFLPPEYVTLYGADDKPVLCKCGKPAGGAVIGREASVSFCTDCSPMNKYQAKFIYKEPHGES